MLRDRRVGYETRNSLARDRHPSLADAHAIPTRDHQIPHRALDTAARVSLGPIHAASRDLRAVAIDVAAREASPAIVFVAVVDAHSVVWTALAED